MYIYVKYSGLFLSDMQALPRFLTSFYVDRYNLLDSIGEMDIVLNKLEQHSENYDFARKEVFRLRKQLAIAELNFEKKAKELIATKKEIINSHKKLLLSQRKYAHCEKICNDVGIQAIGSSYK